MGIRNGETYLASLHDDRQVIYEERHLDDVTHETGFSRTAQAVAQFYDFQSLPANVELMTFQTPDGDRAGMAFKEALSKDDLRSRAAAYAAWAEVTCGFMGRSPDYMNTLLTTLGTVSPLLAQVDPVLARRSRDLYLDARRRDLCYTHTFAEPFKVVPAHGDRPTPSCRVVAESSEGLVISGARSLATLAPFANMNFDLPGGAWYERQGTPYLCGFVTPVAASGLRWICRDKFTDVNDADSPLAGRFDEMDCVAIFEKCLIPWDHVYMFAPLSVETPGMEFVMAGLQHHVLIRSIAKVRFLLGLAHLTAESSRVNQFINIQERLGEIVFWLRTLEALAVAAVEDAYLEPVTNTYHPNPQVTEIAGVWCAQIFPKIIDHVLAIGGSRHMSTTQPGTIELLGDLAEQYLHGYGSDAAATAALFRLAWEVAGSTWGSRQGLYERFHFGDETLRKVNGYLRYDTSQAVAMVRRILSDAPGSDKVFPLPVAGKGAAG